MQSLIERFQDLIEPIQAPLGDIEEGYTSDEAAADGEQPERAQRTLALQQATQRITQNTMALQKLRSHFQKVGGSILHPHSWRLPCLCSGCRGPHATQLQCKSHGAHLVFDLALFISIQTAAG